MLNNKDLRGIVTIIMLAIFFLSVFVPIGIKVLCSVDATIPENFTQAIIQLSTMVVAFYFTNKATKDKMDDYHSVRNGYIDTNRPKIINNSETVEYNEEEAGA